MTLGKGDHVAKLARKYDPDTTRTTHGPEIAENEQYHEFEVIDMTGDQGNPEGFTAKLKKIK